MIRNKLVNYIQRLWYELNWLHIITGFKFFFKRWQVANHPKMRRKEAVIYVANHQNAFMDALAIIMSQRRHPIFLTRANIFASRIARFALRSYNMIPIYRSRDGGDTKAKNEKVMAECIAMLEDGRQPIAIFVEGNHGMKRSLRPLKKGAARIAFQTLEKTGFNIPVKIIPVGVNYTKHSRFRGNLFVNWGDPILVNTYKEEFEENPGATFAAVTNEINKRLEPLIVNIPDEGFYEEIEKAWIAERQEFDNMQEELQNDRAIIARLIEEKRQGLSLETTLPKRKRSLVHMIFGFPLLIYGTLNHLALMLLMRRVTEKFVTDIHFYSSIKLVGGMYLGMLIYVLQAFGVYAFTGGNFIITTIYLFSLPFFGTFAYDHFHKYYSDEPDVTSAADLLKGYK
jgi:1-acyl-sn-glycerol-3-phosphate acyltransferase